MINVTITPKTGSLCIEAQPGVVLIKPPLANDYSRWIVESCQIESFEWNSHLSQGPPWARFALKFRNQTQVAQAA